MPRREFSEHRDDSEDEERREERRSDRHVRLYVTMNNENVCSYLGMLAKKGKGALGMRMLLFF